MVRHGYPNNSFIDNFDTKKITYGIISVQSLFLGVWDNSHFLEHLESLRLDRIGSWRTVRYRTTLPTYGWERLRHRNPISRWVLLLLLLLVRAFQLVLCIISRWVPAGIETDNSTVVSLMIRTIVMCLLPAMYWYSLTSALFLQILLCANVFFPLFLNYEERTRTAEEIQVDSCN